MKWAAINTNYIAAPGNNSKIRSTAAEAEFQLLPLLNHFKIESSIRTKIAREVAGQETQYIAQLADHKFALIHSWQSSGDIALRHQRHRQKCILKLSGRMKFGIPHLPPRKINPAHALR